MDLSFADINTLFNAGVAVSRNLTNPADRLVWAAVAGVSNSFAVLGDEKRMSQLIEWQRELFALCALGPLLELPQEFVQFMHDQVDYVFGAEQIDQQVAIAQEWLDVVKTINGDEED